MKLLSLCKKLKFLHIEYENNGPQIHIPSRRKGLDIMFKSLLDEAIRKTERR